jgi:tetratricopeptide (TPR) repeat protein/DNA-binding CsgD family transcriptional regulator
MIFKNHQKLFFSIVLFLGFSLDSNGQDRSDFEQYMDEVMNCLTETNTDCEEPFKNAMSYVDTLGDDTLAGVHYLRLGNARMRNGRWDEMALDLFELAHSRNLKSEVPCAIVESQFAITRYARFMGIVDSAEVFANRALEAALACGNPSEIARSEVFVGSAFMQRSAYTDALTHFQEAERIYLGVPDSSGLGGLYLDMAILYSEMHQKSESRKLTYGAAEIFKRTGEDTKYSIALIDLSADLLDIKLVDSALTFLAIAEPLISGKHQRAEAFMEQNYGSAYYLLQQYPEAIDHYQKGLKLIEPIGDLNLTIILHNFISQCYREMNDGANAYKYALISDSISSFTPKNFRRTKTYLEIAESAFLIGRYNESYTAFKKYIVLTDSLTGEEKQKEIAALEQAYEAEKRENEIAFHKQENELLAERNEASTNRNYALAACLLLLGVSAYSLIGKKNNRIKAQAIRAQLSKLENETLNKELEHKNRELTSKALVIAQNNRLLEELGENIKSMESSDNEDDLNRLLAKLKISKVQETNWRSFTDQFKELNPSFHKNLAVKVENLTSGELRLAALLRMGLSSKEIASMLGIGEEGMKKARYRLRKKMNLDSDESLEVEIMRL